MKAISRDLTWTPFLSLLRREVARFMKVIAQTVVTPIVNSTLYMMIFGVSLGQQIHLEGDIPYLAFLIPGLVMMACLNNAFQNSSSSIISSKFSGDLEDLRASPLSLNQIIWALNIAALMRGLMVGAITFLVGQAAYLFTFHELLPVAHPFILFVYLILGALAFASIGICVAFWAKNFDQMSAVGGFVLLPLIYLGGVFFSVDHLPPFWKTVSMYNPLLYMINGVRFGILGTSDVPTAWALPVSIAATIVTMAFARRVIGRGNFQRW